MSTEQWKAEYERLAEAVRFAIDYAGGRESEWGERAEECFRILETAVSRKPEQPQPTEDPNEWVIQDRVPVRVGIDEIHWSDWDATRWEVASGHWFPDTRYGSTQDGAVLSVRCRRRNLPKVEQAEQWPKYYKIEDTDIAYMIRLSPTELKYVYKRGHEGTVWRWSEEDEAEHRTEITETEAMALLKPTEPESKPQPQKTRVRLWVPREWNSRSAIISTRIDDKQSNLWQEIHHDSEGFYVEGGQP